MSNTASPLATHEQAAKWKTQLVLPESMHRRVSAHLAEQLINLHESWLSVVKTIRAIRAMEDGRRSTMKTEIPFRHPPLKGLWHTHYWAPTSLLGNIESDWNRKHEWIGLAKRIARFWKQHAGEEFTEQLLNEYAYFMINGPMEDRSSDGRLTGEWIVYAKTADGNVYLTLARHEEGDDVIAERIRKNCGWEFQFLVANSDLFVSPLEFSDL